MVVTNVRWALPQLGCTDRLESLPRFCPVWLIIAWTLIKNGCLLGQQVLKFDRANLMVKILKRLQSLGWPNYPPTHSGTSPLHTPDPQVIADSPTSTKLLLHSKVTTAPSEKSSPTAKPFSGDPGSIHSTAGDPIKKQMYQI